MLNDFLEKARALFDLHDQKKQAVEKAVAEDHCPYKFQDIRHKEAMAKAKAAKAGVSSTGGASSSTGGASSSTGGASSSADCTGKPSADNKRQRIWNDNSTGKPSAKEVTESAKDRRMREINELKEVKQEDFQTRLD